MAGRSDNIKCALITRKWFQKHVLNARLQGQQKYLERQENKVKGAELHQKTRHWFSTSIAAATAMHKIAQKENT